MLSTLIKSKARQKIIKYFFMRGEDFSPHTRKVVKDLSLEINAVRRELINLTDAKILVSSKRGNRVHYFLNKKSRLFYDLASLVAKEEGIFSIIYKSRKKIGNIKFAVGSLRFFLNQSKVKGTLSLIIVGECYISVLESIIKKYEKKEAREVNYMLLSEKEFFLLKERKDSTLTSFLVSPRCVFIGNQNKYLDY